MATPAIEVEIWSDVVCPWCHIGKRRFERALAPVEDLPQTLGRKYGGGRERGLEMIAQVTEVAAGEGLQFHLERARGGNTLDAHRLLQAAHADGGERMQTALQERVLQAYFVDGEQIADPAVLQRLAEQAGLVAARARAVLTGPDYRDAVGADQHLAQSFGATGVPFFVLDRRYGVSGAQPVELFAQALRQAASDPVNP